MWSMGITLYVLTFFVNPFSDIEDTIQGPLTFPQVVSEGNQLYCNFSQSISKVYSLKFNEVIEV